MTLSSRLRSLLKKAGISGLLCCVLVSPTLIAQNLPELSDSATLIMNSEQEKMFGKQVMLSVRARSRFSGDVLLIDYFATLAGNLARNSPRDFGKLTVNVAVDPTINAFAVPGGYITINTGLIQNTRSEAELASVIAHEIGHQSQRHIIRSIERQKQISPLATAAMLGGLLLGGQAGAATIISAQAAAASDQLSYSRTFEREADATGMSMLAASGYDPDAMPAFFSQLEKQSRLYGGIMLDFLSTHPVSSDRIADGRSRASRLQQAPEPPIPDADRLDYEHAQARTRALYDKPIATVIKRFEHTLNDPQTSVRTRQVTAYGLMIAYARNDDHVNAGEILRRLRLEAPNNPLYRLAEAELVLDARDASLAVGLFSELYQSDSSHPGYIEGYASALILNGDNAAAIRILRKTIRHNPDYDWAYGLLSRAYAADGKTFNAIFIEAQEMDRIGMFPQALALLKQQAKLPHPDRSDYLTASMDGLIKKIEEEKRQLDNFDL
jgi:predicted Zn-dependent protease